MINAKSISVAALLLCGFIAAASAQNAPASGQEPPAASGQTPPPTAEPGATAQASQITSGETPDVDVAQGPNGKLMIRSNGSDLSLMNPDGSDQRNVSQHPRNDNWAAWSPDSRRLAWISNRDGEYAIFALELEK